MMAMGKIREADSNPSVYVLRGVDGSPNEIVESHRRTEIGWMLCRRTGNVGERFFRGRREFRKNSQSVLLIALLEILENSFRFDQTSPGFREEYCRPGRKR